MFFQVNGFRCGESCLACATGLGIVALESNLSRTALELEVRLRGDFLSFFLSLLKLCYLVHWNRCMKATCS